MGYKEVYERAYGPVPTGHDIHHKIPRHQGGTNQPENLVALTRPDHAEEHLRLYKEYGDIRDLLAHKMLSGWPIEPEEYRAAAVKRGRTRYERYPEFSSALGKKYGPLAAGSYHYHDGRKSYRYSAAQDKRLSFQEFLSENPQFVAGRLPNPKFASSRVGWVILTDDTRDFWLPKEFRGRLEEFLKLNPGVRVGRKKRGPFKRRTREEMLDGLPRPSKRRKDSGHS